ncbi:MAG: hypothetical protein ABW068_05820, partial [Candidatus Thiodiazotropha sp.]
MKPSRLSLISRITLLVLGFEIAAFGVIGWFYFDHFRSYSEKHLNERFLLVGEMFGNDDLSRCQPGKAKRKLVVPGSREAILETRRAVGAKGDPKIASER